MSFRRVLIANRGEIAVRIIRACRTLGLETVVTVSEADRDTMASRMADRAVCIGPSRSTDSYLNVDAVVAAALGTGCDALHPGYGFLSEKAELGEACAEAGIVFIGPRPETIRDLGNKIRARALATAAGVPVVPGRNDVVDYDAARAAAEEIGLPILLKAAAGGGGRGMQVVRSFDALRVAFETATAEAMAAFGDGTLYVERFIPNARHIEVQVLGDRHGNVIHLGERDCTLQRRHQKVVEEGPATQVPSELVDRMRQAAVDLARGVNYENAGTVEFIYDQDRRDFFFLEVNTRIQVEHPVTEALTGVDLVGQQLRIAAGEHLAIKQDDVRIAGHAIECRVNAEAAFENFRPSPGTIRVWNAPDGEGIRVDTHCFEGCVVPPFYDSMIAKLIVVGSDRQDCLHRTRKALRSFRVEGVTTTIDFLRLLLDRQEFADGAVNTRWIEAVLAEPGIIDAQAAEPNRI